MQMMVGVAEAVVVKAVFGSEAGNVLVVGKRIVKGHAERTDTLADTDSPDVKKVCWMRAKDLKAMRNMRLDSEQWA